MRAFITGAAGSVGSYACDYYAKQGYDVVAIDNFMRGKFFGGDGNTQVNMDHLQRRHKNISFYCLDIRDENVSRLVEGSNLVIHTAAQPSHPKSIEMPLEDFSINAYGTILLLEAVRKHAKDAVFVLTSTNKVYGENPNRLSIVEKDTRYDYADMGGVDESMPVDFTMHTPLGASKLSADIYAQEYARLYGLKTGIFRLSCITGAFARAVEHHNWEPYFVKCNLEGKPLTLFGFKGKQVRDVIHAEDLVLAFDEFFKNPKPGEVYNLGGGRGNSISLLEAVVLIESLTGKKTQLTFGKEREGDHQVYITDFRKFKLHYPNWDIRRNLESIFGELYKTLKTD